MPRTSTFDDYLFLGTGGHVIAVEKRGGKTVWKTSLPKTGYQVVVMFVEDGVLFCGTAGRVFGLDPRDGRILWSNDLPGVGQGVVAMCTVQQSTDQASSVAAQEQADQAAASAAT